MHKQTKNTVILIAVVVVLAAIWFGLQKQEQAQSQQQQEQKEFIADFDVNNATAIRIQSQQRAIRLEEKENSWVVASEDGQPLADQSSIDRLLADVDDAVIQTVVSRSIEKADQYGLSEAEKRHVTIEIPNQSPIELFVGAPGSIAGTFYAMRLNDSTIYLINGAITTFTNTEWKKPETDSALDAASTPPAE
jgi:hypothetical protein